MPLPVRERNHDRRQLDKDRAGTEAKERGLKGGVPFTNSEGAISARNRGTGSVSVGFLFLILSICHCCCYHEGCYPPLVCHQHS